MALIPRSIIERIIAELKVENSRSLYLSALPGDFSKTRAKLDIQRFDELIPDFSEQFMEALILRKKLKYKLKDVSVSLIAKQGVISRKLDALYQTAKLELGEKGYNPVRIGYPLIIQRSNRGTTDCYAVPLLTWSFEMRYDPKGRVWEFDFSETLPEVNQSLDSIVSNGSLGITIDSCLNALGELDEADIKKGIDEAIRKLYVDNPSMRSSFRPLTSLEPIPYRTKAEIHETTKKEQGSESIPPIIEFVNGALLGKFSSSRVAIINDLESFVDGIPEFDKAELGNVQYGATKTDPSQATSYDEIRSGHHLVIHGPPGTGKSETITGLITAAVAEGKTVAVVCQKLAALEVIERNLADIGLTDGVTRITDITKTRGEVARQVRNRSDRRNHYLELLRTTTAKYGETHEQLKGKINKAKQFISERIGPYESWKHLVAKRLELQRKLHNDYELVDLGAISSDQLNGWLNEFEYLQVRFKQWQSDYNRVENAFSTLEFVNEKLLKYNLNSLESQLQRLISEEAKLRNELVEAESTFRSEIDGLMNLLAVDLEELGSIHQSIHQLKDGRNLLLYGVAVQELTTKTASGLNAVLSKNYADKVVHHDALCKMVESYKEIRDRRSLNELEGKSLTIRIRAMFDRRLFADRSVFKKAKMMLADNALTAETFPEYVEQFDMHQSAYYKLLELIGNFLCNERRSGLTVSNIRAKRHKLQVLLSDSEALIDDSDLSLVKLQRRIKTARNSFEEFIDRISEIDWLAEHVQNSIRSGTLTLEGIGESIRHNGTGLIDAITLSKEFQNEGVSTSWFQTGNAPELFECHIIEHLSRGLDDLASVKSIGSNVNSLQSIIPSTQKQILAESKFHFDKSFARGIELFGGSGRLQTVFALRGRSKKSLRTIYGLYPEAMKRVFPVHLITPDALCTLFEGQQDVFDLVIIDEASQIEVYDAIGCLFKGKTIVVAGDEHQMPPSRYFRGISGMVDYDEEDSETELLNSTLGLESILEFCRSQSEAFKSIHLDFHYRSRHPLLIAFSNYAIYNRLVVPPLKEGNYKPIVFHHCKRGIWASNVNDVEATEVVDILKRIEVKDDVPRVVVATMNVQQRNEIFRRVNNERGINASFERKMAKLQESGFAIKNLENLQGDECDILILSTGYGPTLDGRFRRSYSLLSRRRIGYRLMNVLITRARYRVHVVTSIPSSVIDQYPVELANDSTFDRGLFHAYLAYARFVSSANKLGVSAVLSALKAASPLRDASIGSIDSGQFESPFEEEVYFFLRQHFQEDEIELQEPHAQFRIDMVIRPANQPFVRIAVECDGATYHSGWANHLSDIHREEQLKKAGYAVVRVWSTDWWYHRTSAESELLKKIEIVIHAFQPSHANASKEWLEEDWSDQNDTLSDELDLQFELVVEEDEAQEHTLDEKNEKSAITESRVSKLTARSDEDTFYLRSESASPTLFQAEHFEPDDYVNDHAFVRFRIVGGSKLGTEVRIRIIPHPSYAVNDQEVKCLAVNLPLAQALQRKREGDRVKFNEFEYELLEVVQL